jgi:hypothetical protein
MPVSTEAIVAIVTLLVTAATAVPTAYFLFQADKRKGMPRSSRAGCDILGATH